MKNAKIRPYTLETIAVHGGQAPDPSTGSRAVPIHQTTSFVFADTKHAQDLFSLDEAGNIYSRIANPTVDVFEKRMAQLEGGVAAVATASGQAAMTSAIMALAEAGDEIVSSAHLYGGTHTLFQATLKQMGITVRFVDPMDPEAFKEAINEKTKAVVGEVIGNPRLHVLDIERVAKIAHSAGVPLIIDNTFASPVLCRPIEWGADIVIHSATKWIGGHGTSIGGVIIDGGQFDWSNPRFPQYTQADPTYHGIRFFHDFGTLAFSTRVRARYLRDMGASLSPFNAYLLLLGLETLCLRMERHCENAMQIATHLQNHPAVDWVLYPGLKEHPSYDLAQKYLQGGFGAVVVFGIKGGKEAGARLIDRSVLWSHLANVGDAKSLIIHPGGTTHGQMTEEEQEMAGVTPDLIRLSVGIEGVSDLISELDDSLFEATGLGTKGEPILNSESAIQRVAGSATVSADDGDGTDGKTLRRRLKVAVVGLSSNAGRPSHRVARKLQRLGYHIFPVNPREDEVLGEVSFASLRDLDEPVDVVLVFRQAAHAPQIAREAAELPGNPVFWLQEGIISEEAAQIAASAQMPVVMNRCMWKEVQRLQGAFSTYIRGVDNKDGFA